jgi:hypothetical protein
MRNEDLKIAFEREYGDGTWDCRSAAMIRRKLDFTAGYRAAYTNLKGHHRQQATELPTNPKRRHEDGRH